MEIIKGNKYANIYVISDIHGCGSEFHEMLKLIDLKGNDLLIIIGDIIDRGSDGILLLQEICKMENVLVVKGNHEDMMVSAMTGDIDMFFNWTEFNGGDTTFNALKKINKEENFKIVNYAENLPLYKILELNGETYLIVHAGLNIISKMTLEEMLRIQKNNLLWIRKEFLKSKSKHDFKIIFGHTRTFSINYEVEGYPDYYNFYSTEYNEEKIKRDIESSKIWYNDNKNKIGIDCAVSSGGNLACLRLNDMKEFYVKSHLNY